MKTDKPFTVADWIRAKALLKRRRGPARSAPRHPKRAWPFEEIAIAERPYVYHNRQLHPHRPV